MKQSLTFSAAWATHLFTIMLRTLFNGVMRNAPLWILYVQYLLFRFAHFLLEVPTVRMIENAVCHQQLDHVRLELFSKLTEPDEMVCKTALVQDQVARIVGWKMAFDAVPGASPFHLLSNPLSVATGLQRLHMKVFCRSFTSAELLIRVIPVWCSLCVAWATCLHCFGCWWHVRCNPPWVLIRSLPNEGYFHAIYPIGFTLLSSLFLLIGGGPLVFAAVTAALVADLVEPSSRYPTALHISPLDLLTGYAGHGICFSSRRCHTSINLLSHPWLQHWWHETSFFHR